MVSTELRAKYDFTQKAISANCQEPLSKLVEAEQKIALAMVAAFCLKENKEDFPPIISMFQSLADEQPEIFNPDILKQSLENDSFLETVTSMANTMHKIAPKGADRKLESIEVKDAVLYVISQSFPSSTP